MFTGIVEALGSVTNVENRPAGRRLSVEVPFGRLELGASIAVDGACLTVVDADDRTFVTDVSAESLRRTTLGERKPGDRINLERSLLVGDRLGGHFVLGHVDGVGTLVSAEREGEGRLLRFDAPAEVARYLVEKGSVTVDGVSLTVFECEGDAFSVAAIPHTLAETTLGTRRPGDRVNLEADVLGKYVEKLLPR